MREEEDVDDAGSDRFCVIPGSVAAWEFRHVLCAIMHSIMDQLETFPFLITLAIVWQFVYSCDYCD